MDRLFLSPIFWEILGGERKNEKLIYIYIYIFKKKLNYHIRIFLNFHTILAGLLFYFILTFNGGPWGLFCNVIGTESLRLKWPRLKVGPGEYGTEKNF